jgi:hypothetical protein
MSIDDIYTQKDAEKWFNKLYFGVRFYHIDLYSLLMLEGEFLNQSRPSDEFWSQISIWNSFSLPNYRGALLMLGEYLEDHPT